MVVTTVVLSGLPQYVTLKDLDRTLDKVIDKDFPCRDVTDVSRNGKRMVALDFKSKSDAKEAQKILDGREYEIADTGRKYTISARITIDPAFMNMEGLRKSSSSTEYSNDRALVSYKSQVPRHSTDERDDYVDVSNAEARNDEIRKLNKQLALIENERKLLKSQKKLKKEKKRLDDSDDTELERKKSKKNKKKKRKRKRSTSSSSSGSDSDSEPKATRILPPKYKRPKSPSYEFSSSSRETAPVPYMPCSPRTSSDKDKRYQKESLKRIPESYKIPKYKDSVEREFDRSRSHSSTRPSPRMERDRDRSPHARRYSPTRWYSSGQPSSPYRERDRRYSERYYSPPRSKQTHSYRNEIVYVDRSEEKLRMRRDQSSKLQSSRYSDRYSSRDDYCVTEVYGDEPLEYDKDDDFNEGCDKDDEDDEPNTLQPSQLNVVFNLNVIKNTSPPKKDTRSSPAGSKTKKSRIPKPMIDGIKKEYAENGGTSEKPSKKSKTMPKPMIPVKEPVKQEKEEPTDDDDEAEEGEIIDLSDEEQNTQEEEQIPVKQIAKNPRFVMPLEKLLNKMKRYTKDLDEVLCSKLKWVLSDIMRARIKVLVKDIKDYIPTREILKLYRESYPESDDEEFIKTTLKEIEEGKYDIDLDAENVDPNIANVVIKQEKDDSQRPRVRQEIVSDAVATESLVPKVTGPDDEILVLEKPIPVINLLDTEDIGSKPGPLDANEKTAEIADGISKPEERVKDAVAINTPSVPVKIEPEHESPVTDSQQNVIDNDKNTPDTSVGIKVEPEHNRDIEEENFVDFELNTLNEPQTSVVKSEPNSVDRGTVEENAVDIEQNNIIEPPEHTSVVKSEANSDNRDMVQENVIDIEQNNISEPNSNNTETVEENVVDIKKKNISEPPDQTNVVKTEPNSDYVSTAYEKCKEIRQTRLEAPDRMKSQPDESLEAIEKLVNLHTK